jgi:hypothetical protein
VWIGVCVERGRCDRGGRTDNMGVSNVGEIAINVHAKAAVHTAQLGYARQSLYR